MVFDLMTVELVNPNVFKKVHWSDIYDVEEVKEELPPRMPEPWGRSVKMSVFVDADHAVTKRSHTGVLIFLQNVLTVWYSKRQNTVESSTFGSEFVAMRIAKDMAIALRYKCYEVSVLSLHLALPRQGHMEMVYHVFAYLNKHENSKIVFNLMTVELVNPNVFKKVHWSDIYDVEDIKEELPPRMPKPQG